MWETTADALFLNRLELLWIMDSFEFHLLSSPDVTLWTGMLWCLYQLSFWRHPFTAETFFQTWCFYQLSFWRHPFTAETFFQTWCFYQLSFWRHPFTAETFFQTWCLYQLSFCGTHSLRRHFSKPDVFISSRSDGTHSPLRHFSKPEEETHSFWSGTSTLMLISGERMLQILWFTYNHLWCNQNEWKMVWNHLLVQG